MYNPIATYRLQFHKEFSFQEFEGVIDYLKRLGVFTVYASPVFEATPGSTHGYDALNANQVNPEIGTLEQWRNLGKRLQQEGMGWLQDIVPNHMAFDPRNPWIHDVLEKGPQSKYAAAFDIAWSGSLYQGRVMVPFLGATQEEAIANGELKIRYKEGRLYLAYFDTLYPLNPRSYAFVLTSGKEPEATRQFLAQIETLHHTEDPEAYEEQWEELTRQLAGLMKNKAMAEGMNRSIAQVNEDPQRLTELAHQQSYRLCHWQETDGRINYRRFFTVNGLICLNIQDPEVLSQHHQLIRTLVNEGLIQGLRIDHIDGLYDPTLYLEQLREMAGPETYIVVEKILEPGEQLPRQWPIEGNTGYDFLALVNNLMTYKNSEEAFTQYYSSLVEDHRSLPQQIRDKKAHILYHHMGGELDNLYQLLMDSGLVQPEDYAQMRTEDIKTAIAAFLIHCPVYRYYGRQLPLEAEETSAIQAVLEQAKATRPDLASAFALLEKVWLHKPLEGDPDYTAKALHFYQRCMQFTGPLMAKGVEDTLMYTYQRFIGHNEVGDAPEAFGMSVKEFHKAMKQRQQQWPYTINATATHDTKRGEDVRARLNVLSDRPVEWLAAVDEWTRMNAPLRKNGAPDANDEYFIYQTLVGSLPFDDAPDDQYAERLQEYLQKALREAKNHSNWARPDEAYEQATRDFALALLDPKQPFLASLRSFQQKISDFAIVNSLVQLLLKFTCPGIPDVYQGCELWDLSFVDPDNRRPVDYIQREQMLHSFEGRPAKDLLAELWQTRTDARLKLWLTQQLYQLRRNFPELFTRGNYIPLKTEGRYQNHVFAFARKYKQQWILVAAPLHLGSRNQKNQVDLLEWDWEDTAVVLPDELLPEWEHLLTGVSDRHEGRIPAQHLFTTLPLAVLKGRQKENERGAGILLHITSLPSPFGIGDMGPEAYAFADFLSEGHQKYWQLLPLSPTEQGQGHSPYSSTSSRAGNPLLISPELLVKAGLLTQQEVAARYLTQEGKTDYEEAERIKHEMLDQAWTRFQQGSYPQQVKAFAAYREKERSWLPDFAVYMVLKQQNAGKPWYEWETPYRLRDPKALEKLAKEQEEALKKIQWIQFVFEEQWASLKNYCNQRSIQLIGDLPFYVSYDSADVWANTELFSLDEKGQRLGLAGVPPDAFSADGQLWGMPVYKWDVMKDQRYSWWIERLKRNQELFDLVRLDHFRAFADYWEVPAGEETAKNGKWLPGPGADFFEAIREALGELPFVAEDLGEINQAVFDLRDQFQLPGMKVLQFAFDENLSQSDYIPHNYTPNFLVYTGTHDNNTIRGWYREDIDDDTRQRLQQYTGIALSEDDIPAVMARMAYASVARIAILPLQDLLGLDQIARMNIPASGQDNWAWRLLSGQVTPAAAAQLREWTWLYNRE